MQDGNTIFVDGTVDWVGGYHNWFEYFFQNIWVLWLREIMRRGGVGGMDGSGSDHPNGVGMRFGIWRGFLTLESVLKMTM